MAVANLHKLLLSLTVLFSFAAQGGAPAGETLESLKVDIRDVANATAVRPVDGITSSGQPDRDALEVFRNSGYAAVIDLRGKDENRGIDEQSEVEALGMRYLSFPITGRDAVSFENARSLDELIQAQDGPVLIHCGSGNRVGAMLTLIESLHGAEDDLAVAVGKDGGMTGLESVVRQRLDEKSNVLKAD